MWMKVGGSHETEANIIEWEYKKEPRARMLPGVLPWVTISLLPPPNNQNEGEEEVCEQQTNYFYLP